MGQKVNPHGIRVGVIKNWDTQWYANKKNFGANVKEDYEIRQLIKKQYYAAAITTIGIERAASKITVTVHTARPGVLIGKAGSEIEVIKSKLSKLTHGKQVAVNIVEVKKPDCDAQLMAESIASQLEKRASFRRCMKQAIGRAMRLGVKGVKVMVSGRLDEGSIPLQTLRADIEYGFCEAHTTFGVIGVKVWVYNGEILGGGIRNEGGKA